MYLKYPALALVFVALGSSLTACGGGGASSSSATNVLSAAAPLATPAPGDRIKHVVVIVQENRSFDNLFQGYPGADTAASGVTSTGATIPLVATPFEAGFDPSHLHADFEASYAAGKMNGFDHVGGTNGAPIPANGTYGYVPQSEAQPYWDMANQYVLGDRMFESNNSASYTAHQYLIAGQSMNVTDVPTSMPWGCDAPAGTTTFLLSSTGAETPNGPFPCFSYPTIAKSFDAANVSWAYFAPPLSQTAGGIWTGFDAISPVRYGSDWTRNVITPETTVLTDITNGTLPAVSFVIPNGGNSDHSLFRATSGPSWVGGIVNAIGTSAYWQDTAIIVFWDDWGGWYDHVAPAQLDQNGLGFRVPLLIISPYAKRGVVSHTTYETASVLTFIESVFNLPSLGQADARANNFTDAFDFTQPPRPFTAIHTAESMRHILAKPRSYAAPDDD